MRDIPELLVCLSVGRNATSGRARMAYGDRVALELGLHLQAAGAVRLTALHAGPNSPVLRDYAGMGLTEIHRLDLPPGAEIAAEIAAFAQARGTTLILIGSRSETGSSSGLLPYLLARALDWPVLGNVTDIEIAGQGLVLRQTAEGGHRRRRSGVLPAVLAIAPVAAHPRRAVLAASRVASIRTTPPQHRPDPPPEAPDTQPARKRGLRLRPSATAAPVARGILSGHAPQTAAREILTYLRENGLLAEAPKDFQEETPDV